jgi:pyruvate,water dikinase
VGQRWAFWISDVGQEDAESVGKKCANLGEIARLGLPVPQGFCLSIAAHEEFLSNIGALPEIRRFLAKMGDNIHSISGYERASKELRSIVESKTIPRHIQEAIASYYEQLCERCGPDVAVAVRSAGAKSHPGQYETYLNVRGRERVLQTVVKVWSSIFNMSSIAALDRKKSAFDTSPRIGVCILQMVNARSAGVGFTCDPSSGDPERIFIEGSFGLGEGVVSGSVGTDLFVVDKATSEIVERTIGEKSSELVAAEVGVVQKETEGRRKYEPCLSDEEVKQVSEFGKHLESHFGQPQDFEWAFSAEDIRPKTLFLLQTRPVVGVATSSKD